MRTPPSFFAVRVDASDLCDRDRSMLLKTRPRIDPRRRRRPQRRGEYQALDRAPTEAQ
jgi:hypothetical protein